MKKNNPKINHQKLYKVTKTSGTKHMSHKKYRFRESPASNHRSLDINLAVPMVTELSQVPLHSAHIPLFWSECTTGRFASDSAPK